MCSADFLVSEVTDGWTDRQTDADTVRLSD